jgi:hypothetical protein
VVKVRMRTPLRISLVLCTFGITPHPYPLPQGERELKLFLSLDGRG